MTVDSETFLNYFSTLPIGLYPGARKLLQTVRPHYKTALFSNSNVIHWERKMNEMQLAPLFDYKFASHLMGVAKPEPLAYKKVLGELSVPASQVLFFDDNQINVSAALDMGIYAFRLTGFTALVDKLAELGVYPVPNPDGVT